ncbi:hypothetical protein B0H14DRAFT_2564133 [Mycena olivaceomarginata]|nr:hypothetical protein B0H14DRAFT_2564133 [Mycena olivaceomarginata]
MSISRTAFPLVATRSQLSMSALCLGLGGVFAFQGLDYLSATNQLEETPVLSSRASRFVLVLTTWPLYRTLPFASQMLQLYQVADAVLGTPQRAAPLCPGPADNLPSRASPGTAKDTPLSSSPPQPQAEGGPHRMFRQGSTTCLSSTIIPKTSFSPSRIRVLGGEGERVFLSPSPFDLQNSGRLSNKIDVTTVAIQYGRKSEGD